MTGKSLRNFLRTKNGFQFFQLKTIVIILFLGFSVGKATAQRDLITTQAGEKIRCRILDETPNRFIYAYLSPSGKVLRNEIFKNLVTEFKYNFYSSDIVVNGKKMPEGVGAKQEENTSAASTKQETKKTSSEPRKTSKQEKDVAKKINNDEEFEEKKTTEPSKKSNSPRDMSGNKPAEEKKEETKTDTKKADNNAKTPEKTEPKKSTATTKPVEKEEPKGKAPLADKQQVNDFENLLKFRIGAKAGFGQLLQKVAETNLTEYGLYNEKLNRGWTWGADAAYFPREGFGFGAMFNNFQSKNVATSDISYVNIFTDKEEKGIISNKRSTKFAGPVFYFRKSIDYKTMVILGLAPGAYFYSDKGTYGDTNYTAKGLDYGAAATLGIDFMLGNDIIGRDIILSLEAGYNYGKMRALNYGDGNGAKILTAPIDMSRVDLTIGLRFTRYPKYLRLTSY